jgi:hypothetical protein
VRNDYWFNDPTLNPALARRRRRWAAFGLFLIVAKLAAMALGFD